jgi:phosphate-selective porin OprO/OprP
VLVVAALCSGCRLTKFLLRETKEENVKGKIIAAGLLASLAVTGNADAKSLEDILKEKGVITEADYKEVSKSAPISYKMGDGFTFRSSDEKFSLSMGGRLQARYSFFDKDDVNGSAQDVSEWRVRRAKFWLKGHAYTKDLTYKVQVNFVEGGSNKLLEDAALNYKFIKEAQLQVGQEKVPFARQELTSSGAQQFVDRSSATDAFKPGRDIGAMLHGSLFEGILGYNLGWYGGAGQSVLRSSNNNALAARIAVNPLGEMKYSEADLDNSQKPLVSFGANYFGDSLKATRVGTATTLETNNLGFAGSNGWLGKSRNWFTATEKLSINTFGLDGAFKWQGFSAQGEYFIGQAEGDITNKLLRGQGFYAQMGYFIIPKHLEVAARYSYVDPNRDVSNDLNTQVQGAVSYYFNKHNLKLQGDVTNIHQQVALPNKNTDEMQFRLQAQIIF